MGAMQAQWAQLQLQPQQQMQRQPAPQTSSDSGAGTGKSSRLLGNALQYCLHPSICPVQ